MGGSRSGNRRVAAGVLMTKRAPRQPSDRLLGMNEAITRRDFVHGALLGAGALALPALAGCSHRTVPLPPAAQDRVGYYPPTLTGLRGSHPGAFEPAHALRDGQFHAQPLDIGEDYDLVIVGGGISGLSAAHFFRKERPNARILILENHDDFGGHAKRNEIWIDGQMRLLNGGTYSIESPRPYSAIADGVLRDVGIDAAALSKETQKKDFYRSVGLTEGVFFDRETFGRDHLAAGYRQKKWPDFLKGAPLSDAAKRDIERVESGSTDYFPGLTGLEKKQKLLRMSYLSYLRDVVKVDPSALALYQAMTQGWWGVGIDAIGALDAWGSEMPGFEGLRLPPGSIPGMGYTPAGFADTGGSTFMHFPDGNASIARALVRRLIPAAVPGSTIEDLVTARVDYRQLDREGEPVRLRLNSVVVGVHHDDPDAGRSKGVRVAYVRDGRVLEVRATQCVLACYNALIPYLVPELPAHQKAALHEAIKTPLVYTSVGLANARPFHEAGVHSIYAPGGYHTSARLNLTVDIGDYRSPRSPDEPTLLAMVRTPCRPGLTEHEQNKVGRAELLATPFETFEREIRDQLRRMLGGTSFDPARDIRAIVVNRWPHGYAPENNPLFDRDEPEGQEHYVRARTRFGRIAIANSDAGAGAYTDVAIEQGHRAVYELLGA
jgi:spermidine dehydrogenase